MSLFNKSMSRRTFIKGSCAAGVFTSVPIAANALSQKFCQRCRSNLSDSLMVSASGHCRNCGANVDTGKLDLPNCLFPEHEPKSPKVFAAFIGITFSTPEIQHLTQKPCASAAELRRRVRGAQAVKGQWMHRQNDGKIHCDSSDTTF